jgi:hypothetical protein
MIEEQADGSADSTDRTEGSSEQPEKPDEEREEAKPKRPPASRRSPSFTNFYVSPAVKLLSNSLALKLNAHVASLMPKSRFIQVDRLLPRLHYKSPLDNIAEQFNKSLRVQWEPLFESIRKLTRNLFPSNWGDARPPSIDVLESILVDEGIPLMWVPGPKIVEAIFKAGNASERRRVISRRWKGIIADCEAVLDGVTFAAITDERDFALQCVQALRDGHTSAAQALAANLLDSVLRKYFNDASRQKVTSNNFLRDGIKFDLDDHIFRVSLTFAPVWCAHVKYRTEHGDPIPSTYGRHPSAHAVSRTQYKRVNAVLAIMVVTSVIKFFDIELARQEARAGE